MAAFARYPTLVGLNLYFSPDLPNHYLRSLELYVSHGCSPGGFLEKVLANEFEDAYDAADVTSTQWVSHLIKTIRGATPQELPAECHGSYEAVKFWVTKSVVADSKPWFWVAGRMDLGLPSWAWYLSEVEKSTSSPSASLATTTLSQATGVTATVATRVTVAGSEADSPDYAVQSTLVCSPGSVTRSRPAGLFLSPRTQSNGSYVCCCRSSLPLLKEASVKSYL